MHTESSKNLSIVAPLSKESSNNIINYLKRNFNPKEFAKQNIEKNFGQSVEELQNNFTDDIKNILAENEISPDEFEIEDVRLYGSYTTGKNKDTSDLDVIVQYKGSMKEDSAFNILNDTNLTITDVNGVERKVDINPINRELSGTIDEHIERMHEIDGAYFQTVNTAGAETSAEISEAKKEWLEKGTDSKYFKKWFGDSKVVDENGKPLVVYHGTTANNIEIFEPHNASTDFDYPNAIYFSDSINIAKTYGDTYHKEPMQVYLKMENPLEINTKGQTYNDFYDELKRELNYAVTNYDGLIVKNIRDDWAQNDGGEIATTYIVFNPEQIKSVDNRGTFDEGNANIYYQSAYHGTPHKFDNFSTEHIGSGEGAQAHGWGLYFASNKDISENYRKDLLESYNNMSSFKYKGQPVEEENLRTALYRLKKNGLEDALFYIDKKIQFYKEQYERDKKEYSRVKGYLETKKILLDRAVKVKKMLKDVNPDDIDINNGQLYEVDIPEDDVMLDEDLPFSKQSKKVQEGLKSLTSNLDDGMSKEAILEEIERIEIKIEENENNDYIDLGQREYISECLEMALDHMKGKLALVDIENSNLKGRTIYKAISEHLESDELASKKLNEYGIKGIKYNGHQDGECYVVFDDKAVQVLNTFYQSSDNDYNINRLSNDNQEVIKQNEFNITSELVTYKDFIKEFSNTLEDVPKDYEINDLQNALKDLKIDRNTPKTIKTPIGDVFVTADTIEHIISREDDKTRYKSINKMFMTLEKPTVVNRSKNGGVYYYKIFKEENNTKNQTVVVRTNELGEVVKTTFPTKRENNFFNSLKKGETIYDVKNKRRKGNNNVTPVNTIITDNANNFNPNVQYQSNYSSPLENLHKRVEEKRAIKVHEYKGYFTKEAEKNIIGIMQNADASTVIHELGHVCLNIMI